MQLQGKVMAGITTTVVSKKTGEQINKAKLKVLDVGDEAGDDLLIYWIDFWGDSALSQDEIEQIKKQEVAITIRRVTATTGKNGNAYLNFSGGLVTLNGAPVQAKFRTAARKSA